MEFTPREHRRCHESPEKLPSPPDGGGTTRSAESKCFGEEKVPGGATVGQKPVSGRRPCVTCCWLLPRKAPQPALLLFLCLWLLSRQSSRGSTVVRGPLTADHFATEGHMAVASFLSPEGFRAKCSEA